MSADQAIQEDFRPGLPSRLDVRVGTEGRFPLPSRAGAGYQWHVSLVAGEADATTLAIETGPAPEQGAIPQNLPVPMQLVVTGLREGTARWRLRLVRPWMPGSPLVDQELQVLVRQVESDSS